MVVSSGSLWAREIGYDKIIFFEFIIILGLLILHKKHPLITFYSIIIPMFLVLQYITENIFLGTLLGICIKIFIVLAVMKLYSSKKFWTAYINCIIFLATLSLIAFVWFNFLRSIIPISILTRYTLDNGKLYNMGFALFKTFSYFPLARNHSIFWEPGAYQFFLNIALFINTYYQKKLFTKKNIILIVSVFTTFSTTGYLVMLLIFIDYFMIKRKRNFFKYAIQFLLVLSFLVPIYMSRTIIYKFNIKNPSLYRRIQDTIIDFELFKDYWIWGYGRDSNIPWHEKYYKVTGNHAQEYMSTSNSLLALFSQFGFFFGMLFLFPLFKGNSFLKKKLIFLAIILCLILTENFVFSIIFITLLLNRRYEISNNNVITT